jgi:hypothetical protein
MEKRRRGGREWEREGKGGKGESKKEEVIRDHKERHHAYHNRTQVMLALASI